MIAHRHEGDGEHIFVDAQGQRFIASQGFSYLLDTLPPGMPCPDCEAEKAPRVKLGTRVRVTRDCALDLGTAGIVTWRDHKTAAVLVSEQELAARVPLDALEVVS